MENNIQMLPGYRINEYLLVLSPPEEVWNKIVKVKEEFAETYHSTHARWGKPHITLASFVQYEMMEARIVNRLKAVGMAQYPFKAELRDYGSFPSHTIYINVVTKVPVQGLVKQLRSETQRLMKLNEDKPHFITEPHVTVARNLQPWQYEKAWLAFSNKHFTGRFIADSMLLLKRPQKEIKAYQIVQRFAFQNLPVATIQGELFN